MHEIALAAFTKPIGQVVEALQAAGATLYGPIATVRKAKADVKAKIIRTKGDIQVRELRRRALARVAEEDARHQQNLESIVHKAERFLAAPLPAQRVEPDWIFHFLTECRNTSNSEMQELWARLLAGELSAPGTFSRRTVSFIKLLEPSDAKSFANLCQLAVDGGPLVVNSWSKFAIERLKPLFGSLDHLDAIGLIRYSSASVYSFEVSLESQEPRLLRVGYFHQEICLDVTSHRQVKPDTYDVGVGHAIFTKQGKELSRLVERTYDERVFNYLVDSFRSFNTYVVTTEE